MRIIDISPTISSQTAVFPGDQSFSRKVAMSFANGQNLELSSIHTTVHIGAHTDAPNHYSATGEDMANRSLEYYYGDCQVFHLQLSRGERLQVGDLQKSKHFMSSGLNSARVLFRTDSFPDPNSWNGDFNALSADLVNYLASRGVKLVGIDTPSIDLADDKVLESHQAVALNNMAILEGVILGHVDEGRYILSALPLKIAEADASPVRAVLITKA